MYEVEALQVFLRDGALQDLVDGADPVADQLNPAQVKRLAEAIRLSPMVSNALRSHLAGVVKRL
jgi:hypothetical protein